MKATYFLLPLLCGTLGAAPLYTITALGSLGGNSTAAFGLNSSGEAVGTGITATGLMRAFEESGSDFRVISAAGFNAMASGINDTGAIAGTQYGAGGPRATLWQHGATTSLGQQNSFAMAVNNDGIVVGSAEDPSGSAQAMLWSNGTTQALGTLPGTSWSSAYGISSSNQVVGYSLDDYGRAQAFVWSSRQGMTQVAGLGGSTYAMAINDSGVIAGSSIGVDGLLHAFTSQSGNTRDLGTLGAGSTAYGINSAGDVVGYSYRPGADDASAVLYRGGAIYDLNTLLANASGWQLHSAYAINSAGQIAGSGTWNGQSYAFRLDPVPTLSAMYLAPVSETPEPAAWLMVGLGMILVAIGLRRRNSR